MNDVIRYTDIERELEIYMRMQTYAAILMAPSPMEAIKARRHTRIAAQDISSGRRAMGQDYTFWRQ